jgi:hypothetical protein
LISVLRLFVSTTSSGKKQTKIKTKKYVGMEIKLKEARHITHNNKKKKRENACGMDEISSF